MIETTHEDVTVETIDRDEFVRNYWDYKAGQHVTIIGPNGVGKTRLGFDLLGATATREMPAYVLVSKPRDVEIDRYTKKLHFKTITEYPPYIPLIKSRRPPGYMVRPEQSLKDLKADNARLHQVFEATIMGCYSSPQPRIVFADEVQELQSGLKLKEELEACWKRGRSLKCGLWALAQRSAYNSQDMYNSAAHLFLFNDPDKRNRVRFSEIGGVDPDLVMDTVYRLDQFQVLYIKRAGPCLCIVNP